MASKHKSEFQPDYAVHPGETLRDTLKAKHMTLQSLAQKTGIARRSLLEIVNEKRSIDVDVAERLFQALGVPVSFWLNMQSNYETTLERLRAKQVRTTRLPRVLHEDKPMARAV